MHSPGTSSSTTGPWNISDVAPRFGSTKLASAIIRAALALVALTALLLIAALPAQAQTETVLYNFTGGADGFIPNFILPDGAGNFYGSTLEGAHVRGGTNTDVASYMNSLRTAAEAGTRPCSTPSARRRMGRIQISPCYSTARGTFTVRRCMAARITAAPRSSLVP